MMKLTLVTLFISLILVYPPCDTLIFPQLQAGTNALMFTIPNLSTLTQEQLLLLGAGGLSLAAAGGLTKLAVASSLLADEPSSGGGYGTPSGGYGEPSYHAAPEPEYHVVSSGYGHGHARSENQPQKSKFRFQWQENIAKHKLSLSRRRRDTDVEPVLNDFLKSLNDRSGCGRKYLCQLSSMDTRSLTADEKEIISFFYNNKVTLPTTSGITEYRAAVEFGEKNKNFDLCHDEYNSCKVLNIVKFLRNEVEIKAKQEQKR